LARLRPLADALAARLEAIVAEPAPVHELGKRRA
jgi:hypothetical protein